MTDSGGDAPPDPRWTGVLLVGGAGRRMGQDKLRRRLPGGERLADLPARALAGCCGRLAAARSPGTEPLGLSGFRDLVDVVPGGGPLAGVVAALQSAETPWLLILGGDMPRCPAAFLRAFMALAEQDPHSALMIGTRSLQPMPLALPAELGGEVIRRFERGERALRRAVPSTRLRLAEPDLLPRTDGRAPWLGVNTPEEWEHFVDEACSPNGCA